MSSVCPECGVALPVEAVLCIDCGFHRTRGERLVRAPLPEVPVKSSANASSVPTEAQATFPDANDAERNPFAPVAPSHMQLSGDEPLTEAVAEKANRIAEGAFPIYLSLACVLCLCFPILPALLPLFVFRLFQWHQLYQRYRQLREPNSLSQFAEVEVRFQDAWLKYAVSVGLGILQLIPYVVIWAAGGFTP